MSSVRDGLAKIARAIIAMSKQAGSTQKGSLEAPSDRAAPRRVAEERRGRMVHGFKNATLRLQYPLRAG